MSDAAAGFLTAVVNRLGTLERDQRDAIDAAAGLIAQTVAARGVVHVHDTGHMIGQELVARTGGLVAFRRLEYSSSVTEDGSWRARNAPVDVDAAAATRSLLEWVFRQPALRAGDTLILSSVSGNSIPVVELALQARRHDLRVIALTGVRFSSRLEPRHPSGKKLLDLADVLLDNLADYGDSFYRIPDFDDPVCPISGVAGATLMWAVVAAAVEALVGRGVAPTVYPSINLPDGPARVAAADSRYRERGF